ncbi:ankyrin repeat domain-containing protein [Lentzea sp. CA-135723]|uniref:ankyrin repeat domain-containing protein n=1 Tax=Lentzea sp. CA-135723 TaxID=3239950 RepID=UPI003D926C13
MGAESQGWQGFSYHHWKDLAAVRARLEAGADPDGGLRWGAPLHTAVEFGTAEVVAELAGRVADVDQVVGGRTALWNAVHARQQESARVLLAAGADPLRPMMSGWSPARLSLTTPHVIPSDEVLTAAEWAATAECGRLVAALKDFRFYEGYSLACVAGVSAADAVGRLNAEVVSKEEAGELLEDSDFVAGVTDVPGGCIVMQPRYFLVSTPLVLKRLSAGTVAYGMYANAKSGNQGSSHRDGEILGWDLHPGGGPGEDGDTEEVLMKHLYVHQAVAFCCAYAGVRPKDAKAFTEPDRWLVLPDVNYWDA